MEAKRRFSVIDFIALFAISLLVALIGTVIFFNMPETVGIQIMTNSFTLLGVILSFYFVNSKASTTKDETISSMQKQSEIPTKAENVVVEKADNVTGENVTVTNS